LLIGYGANADRNEDWRTNPEPIHDSQQPWDKATPLVTAPRLNTYDTSTTEVRSIRDADKGFFITGQVTGFSAVHSGSDIPLSAYGAGANLLRGTIDNTDVFFAIMQGVIGGTR
jgi:alkaline phosphatase